MNNSKKSPLGKKCFSCKHFWHNEFDQHGRKATTFKHTGKSSTTFGECRFLDAQDAIGFNCCEAWDIADDAK